MSKEKNKGITLVALIISIIVMLILVAVVLAVALGKNGIIKNTKESKEETTVEMEKEKLLDAVFATVGSNGEVELEKIVLPEGFKEISKDENKAIYQGSSGQLYEVENITGKITEIDKIPEEMEDLKITLDTQGVTFTKSDGVTPGDPNKLQNGDIVIYGDYKYTYNSSGWSVAVTDKTKEQYGKIAEEIFGKPIISMYSTFNGCTNMKISPEIPKGVTNIYGAFRECTSLIKMPEIPIGVSNMGYAFYNCTSIDGKIIVPSGVETLQRTFQNCRALTVVPKLSEGLINLNYTFYNCSALTTAPEIPKTVTSLAATFYGCTSLKQAPLIPNSVTDLSSAFAGCTSLVEVAEIPSSVNNMNRAFQSCSKLEGVIIVNASPTTYPYCFQGAGTQGTGIVLKGTSTLLNELAATNNNGKVTVGN